MPEEKSKTATQKGMSTDRVDRKGIGGTHRLGEEFDAQDMAVPAAQSGFDARPCDPVAPASTEVEKPKVKNWNATRPKNPSAAKG